MAEHPRLSIGDLPDDILTKIFRLLLPSSVPHLTVRHLLGGLDAIALSLASARLLAVARSVYAQVLVTIDPCPGDNLLYATDTDADPDDDVDDGDDDDDTNGYGYRRHSPSHHHRVQPFTVLRPSSQPWVMTLTHLPFIAGPLLRKIDIPRGVDAQTMLLIVRSLRRNCAQSLTHMSWYDDCSHDVGTPNAAFAKAFGRQAAKLIKVVDVRVRMPSQHTLRHTLSLGFPALVELSLHEVHPANLQHISFMLHQRSVSFSGTTNNHTSRRPTSPLSPPTSPSSAFPANFNNLHGKAMNPHHQQPSQSSLHTLRLYVASGLLSQRRREEDWYSKFWTYIQTGLVTDAPKLHTLALCTGNSLTTCPAFVHDLDRFDRSKRTDLPAYTTFEVYAHAGFTPQSTNFADHQNTRILPPWRVRSHKRVLAYQLDAILPLLMFIHGSDQYGDLTYEDVVHRMHHTSVLLVSPDSERVFRRLCHEDQQHVKTMYQEHCTNVNAIIIVNRQQGQEQNEQEEEREQDETVTETLIHIHRLLVWNRGRIKFCSIPVELLVPKRRPVDPMLHTSMLQSFASALGSSSCASEVSHNASTPFAGTTKKIPTGAALRIRVAGGDETEGQWDFGRACHLVDVIMLLASTWAEERSAVVAVHLERVRGVSVGRDEPWKRKRMQAALDALRQTHDQLESLDINSVLGQVTQWLQ